MVNQPHEESQLHLEAMLYVLEDPALDRAAFEAKLESDVRLGEILAEAVELFHAIRPMDVDSDVPMCTELPAVRTYVESRSSSKVTGLFSPSSWRGFASLAASILLVGFLGWKSFQVLSPSMVRYQGGSLVDGSAWQASDAETIKNVASAWGEIGTGHHEEHLSQYISFVDNDITLAACDTVCENDVPEWIVMATAAILERGNSVDASLEDLDTRTLIQ